MSDYLVRGTAAGGQIRAVAVVTTSLTEEARKRHDTYPTATAALGRVLTAALLMGATLAEEDTITLRVFGNGPLGGIIATADAQGLVRGYVQEPHTHLPATPQGKLDVGGAVGSQGFIYVTKDIGLGEPYTGSAPLVSGEIAEDLTNYLMTSEQIPSVVALGVLVETDNAVRAAGGYLIQLMPGYSEDTLNLLEKNVEKTMMASQMVAQGMTPEDMLQEVLSGLEFKMLENRNTSFACPCSKERLERVLISLGEEELASIISDQGGAELVCHFCGDNYNFNKDELESLIKQLNSNK